MNDAFQTILISSYYSMIVGLVILVIQKVFRLRPKWNYLIWTILIVKMILPFGPPSSLSLFNLASPPTEIRQTIDAQIPSSGAVSSMSSGLSSPLSVSEPSPVPSEQRNWSDLFCIIWVSGMLAMAVWLLVSSFVLHYRLRKYAKPADDRIQTILLSCKNKLGIQKPILALMQEQWPYPSICGIFRTKILLGSKVSGLQDQEIESILFHELSHYKRGDILANLVLLVLQTIYWFHPVIWFLFHRIRHDMELATDEKALSYLDATHYKQYGNALLTVAEGISSAKLTPKMLGLAGDKKNLEKRVRMIAAFQKPKVIWSVAAAVLLVIVGIICLTSAVSHDGFRPKQQTDDSQTRQQVEEYLDQIVHDPDTALSSNPYTYIRNNQAAFDALVALGSEGKDVMFQMFEESQDNGLKEYIMAVACNQILGGEPANVSTGRDWYQHYGKLSYPAESLLQHKTHYLGDSSNTSAIVSLLPIPPGLRRDGISLQTSQPPYGLTISYTAEDLSYKQYHYEFDMEWERQSLILFSLIENLDLVTFQITDPNEVSPQVFHRSREFAVERYPDLLQSSCTDSLFDFEHFLREVSNQIQLSRHEKLIKQEIGPNKNIAMNSGIASTYQTITEDIIFRDSSTVYFKLSDLIPLNAHQGNTLEFYICGIEDVTGNEPVEDMLFILCGNELLAARSFSSPAERAAAIQAIIQFPSL